MATVQAAETSGPAGFGGGFGMNPYGFGGMMGGFGPGMLNMLANSMGMNAMAGGAMGGGGEQGFRKDRVDTMRGSTGGNAGYKSGYSGDNSGTNTSDGGGGGSAGYGGQNSSGYEQTSGSGMSNPMGDMPAYNAQMNSMWGGGVATPASVQAAMLAGYSGVGMDNSTDYSQLGAYNNQTASYYGPSRGATTGKPSNADAIRKGFKPY